MKIKQFGVLFRRSSFWVGAHWSGLNQRLCINFTPFVTLWITFNEGKVPVQGKDLYRSTVYLRRNPTLCGLGRRKLGEEK